MRVEKHAFGVIEHYSDRIIVIAVDDGLEIDLHLAHLVINAIRNSSNKPMVVIVDRRNDYSYSGDGMQTLSDANLPGIITTAIVVYSKTSELVTACQVGTMKILGRTNLNIFRSLEDAFDWAIPQVELYDNSQLLTGSR